MRVRPAVWAFALAGIGASSLLTWALLPDSLRARPAASDGSATSAGPAGAARRGGPERSGEGRVWPPEGAKRPLALASRAPAARQRVEPALHAPAPALEPTMPRMAIDLELKDPEALRQFRADRDDAARLADQLGLVDREAVDRVVDTLKPLPGEEAGAFRDRVGDTRRSVFAQAFLAEYETRLYYQSAEFPNGYPMEAIRASIASRIQGLDADYQAALLPVALASFQDLPSEPHFDSDPRNVWSQVVADPSQIAALLATDAPAGQ